MQIYCNKRKRLHKKRVQLPGDWFGTPIWPPWRHVKTLYWKCVGITNENWILILGFKGLMPSDPNSIGKQRWFNQLKYSQFQKPDFNPHGWTGVTRSLTHPRGKTRETIGGHFTAKMRLSIWPLSFVFIIFWYVITLSSNTCAIPGVNYFKHA